MRVLVTDLNGQFGEKKKSIKILPNSWGCTSCETVDLMTVLQPFKQLMIGAERKKDQYKEFKHICDIKFCKGYTTL